MKIMIVAPYFYPKAGGMENYAYNIAKGLKKKYRWEVFVVTSNHEKKEYKTEIIDGLKIYRLPTWFKISNTPINPLWYFQIKKIIKEEKPDLINAHSPVPFISDITALINKNLPFYLTYHGVSMKKNESLKDILISSYEKVILKFTLGQCCKIICSSDYIKYSFLKKYFQKTVTITPGVDTKLFKQNTEHIFYGNKVLVVGGLKKAESHKQIKDVTVLSLHCFCTVTVLLP